MHRYRDNVLLNHFVKGREKRWMPPVKRRKSDMFSLQGFSFIDNPNHTLELLSKLAHAECELRSCRLDFADERITDISPYVIWSIMRSGMAPFISGGLIGRPVQKVLEACKLRTSMNMRPFKKLQDLKDVIAFSLRQRHRAGTSTAIPEKQISFSIVADELVSTINDWLGSLDDPEELTDVGMDQVSTICTEVLENAERHGRKEGDGDWYVAGFMARRDGAEERTWHVCHLAFVNLGLTIAETIGATPHPDIKANLEKYVARHTSRELPARALATVYALQDGVSAKPEAKGGRGMMELVDMTNSLGDQDVEAYWPRMSIISGDVCVEFRDQYRARVNDDKARFQPFNGTWFENKPDQNYVRVLDNAFPGTIVAIRFSLAASAREEAED